MTHSAEKDAGRGGRFAVDPQRYCCPECGAQVLTVEPQHPHSAVAHVWPCGHEISLGRLAETHVYPPAKTRSDRGHANANRVARTGLIVVGLGTGASFAHPYLAWWMIPLVFLWLLAGVAIACVVGGGEH